jgi:hypothetical protein
MTDYTSFEVSKRLDETGFSEPTNAIYAKGLWGEGKDDWKLSIENMESMHKKKMYVVAAYRVDTLFAWLLERGFFDYIMKNVSNEIAITFTHSKFLTGDVGGKGKTLSDALAEIILKVWNRESLKKVKK